MEKPRAGDWHVEHVPTDIKQENYLAAKRVTQVGTGADTFLTVAKLVVGFLTNSAALMAEGLHSAADLLFDIVVLVGMRFAREEADEGHPYGHGKFESIATLILAILLLGVAVGISWDAAHRIQAPNLEAPGQMALWVAGFSMVIKEFLFQYTVRVGRRINSKITVANAWHHRADSIASFAALLGIGGALLGYPILDPLAAIGVAFFVGKVGVEIALDALKELTDSVAAIDDEVRATIKQLIHDHPEVKSVHLLKARRMGPDIMVDVHVVVDSFLTVSEGHQVAEQVEKALYREVPEITAVMVHVDTVDDVEEGGLRLFADRGALMMRVGEVKCLEAPLTAVQAVLPHYTQEGIVAEVFLTAAPGATVAEAQASASRLARCLHAAHDDFAAIRTHLLLGEERREG